VASADAAAVFVEGPVEDVMATVLDTPVPAIELEEPLGVGLLGRATGETVGEFDAALAGLFVEALALDDEGLPDMGEVEVPVEGRGGPDPAGFDPAVVRRRGLDEIGLLALLEGADEVVQQEGVVRFDGDMLRRGSGLDQVTGKPALGQQRIGGDSLAVKRQGFQQGDGHGDFVGGFRQSRVR
jgi:hypothetical protein